MRVIVDEFFHSLGAVVDHLQKERPARGGYAAEGADNGVVDKLGNLARFDGLGPVRVEDLKEVTEAFSLGFETEVLVRFQVAAVEGVVIVERDTVKPEVDAAVPLVRCAVNVAALDMVKRGGSERERRLGGILAAADDVNVRGVVGTASGGHGTVVEDALVERQ